MRRSPLEMAMRVLFACREEGLAMTHIMYKVNVNCSVLKKILGELQKLDYLRREAIGSYGDGLRFKYTTTQKGAVLLARWAEFQIMSDLMDPLTKVKHPARVKTRQQQE